MNAPTLENTYLQLPDAAYTPFPPDPVASPGLIRINDGLARSLGIDPDWLSSAEGLEVLAGNRAPEGASPIATAYSGHQFGNWNPTLGDGRAVLLGELVAPSGERFDLQLKGSGPTRYSRGGDGRAPIGPVLREYIVAEAMAAMGVPTTRALAAVSTGETVYRETPAPGAILTRVARSHIRVGTVQYFAALGDIDGLKQLLDYVIQRHFPEVADGDHASAGHRYLALLSEIQRRQAELVARWQHLGFIHGVMNTDNMLLCGDTVDYGPCAFLDAYQPDKVFSSIDHGGRYAFENQPAIAHWNICRLAEAMLPAIDEDQERAVQLATAVIEQFPDAHQAAWENGLANKLGLPRETGVSLGKALLSTMAEAGLDFTQTFDALTRRARNPQSALPAHWPADMQTWVDRWQSLAPKGAVMRQANPSVIPRNHVIEAVIDAAVSSGDLAPFHAMVDAVVEPFTETPADDYVHPPKPGEEVRRTFCGT